MEEIPTCGWFSWKEKETSGGTPALIPGKGLKTPPWRLVENPEIDAVAHVAFVHAYRERALKQGV